MSTVTVDEPALDAGLAALEAGLLLSEPVADVPAEPASQPVDASVYEPVAFLLVDQLFDGLAPAWKVTIPEKEKLSKSIAVALTLWFPDQVIPPKYLALLGVAGAGWSIVSARRDPKTGKLPPRIVIDEEAQATA